MKETPLLYETDSAGIYTVGALTEQIRSLLESHFEFVWVEGEISNFRAPSSGHFYMVLKDEDAQIRAVMFRPQARYLRFLPEDGMKVIAQGRIALYRPRGEYQIILDYLEPLGVGALALAFEQLKKKLAAQGVFDRELKRTLPLLPRRVAVITSPTGAAVRDFLKVVHRRFANLEIVIVPVKVQGEDAAAQMIKAIETVNRELDVDVIVLTRGGGSLEDLWAYNQESLALAVRASRIPVVSAVGHEIDITICDLAADLRAPTPSAAAELLVVEKEVLCERLKDTMDRLRACLGTRVQGLSRRLEYIRKGLRDPRRRFTEIWIRLDEIQGRMIRAAQQGLKHKGNGLSAQGRSLLLHSPANLMTTLNRDVEFLGHSLRVSMARVLKDERKALEAFEGKLHSLGPYSILRRGYSISYRLPERTLLRSVEDAGVGEEVGMVLSDGELTCRIERKETRRNPLMPEE